MPKKTLYLKSSDDALLKQLALQLTEEGAIKRDNRNLPSESAAVRWLIEQEAKRRGIARPPENGGSVKT